MVSVATDMKSLQEKLRFSPKFYIVFLMQGHFPINRRIIIGNKQMTLIFSHWTRVKNNVRFACLRRSWNCAELQRILHHGLTLFHHTYTW